MSTQILQPQWNAGRQARVRVAMFRRRAQRRLWRGGVALTAVLALVVWSRRPTPIIVSEAEMARRVPVLASASEAPPALPLVAPAKPVKRVVHAMTRETKAQWAVAGLAHQAPDARTSGDYVPTPKVDTDTDTDIDTPPLAPIVTQETASRAVTENAPPPRASVAARDLWHDVDAARARGDFTSAARDLDLLASQRASAPQALFTLGRLYEESLADPHLAMATYRRLLHEFATHPLAVSARLRIEALKRR